MKQKKQRMKNEFKSIDEFIEKVGIADVSFIKDIVQEDNKYYLIPDAVKKIKENIPKGIFSVGTILGERKRGIFKPTLQFIDLLSQESENKAVLEKKSAWLFLCGRDVFGSSLQTEPKKGFIFLQNTNGENLGLGYFDGKNVLNVIDRGDFLRREK